MRLYLDTNIVSALVRGDLSPRDQRALHDILGLADSSACTLAASTVVREELERIPPEFQREHLAQYELLAHLRGSAVTWMDEGSVVTNSVYAKLRTILPDEPDARHLFQASENAVEQFVTADYKTILRYASEIERVAGVHARSPSQFVGWFQQQQSSSRSS